MKRALWFGLCFLCGCSSGKNVVPPAPSEQMDSGVNTDEGGRGGGSGKAGKGGKSGGSGGAAGQDATSAAQDPLAPSISFTLPNAADGPDSQDVNVDSSVRVHSQLAHSDMTGSSPVDKTSVKITLQDTRAQDADAMHPVHASVYFRALVVDHTNHSEGSHIDYLSGTKQSSVNLFLQRLNNVALLIDTNGDRVCDTPPKPRQTARSTTRAGYKPGCPHGRGAAARIPREKRARRPK
jgi:hypothetical protein